ncbi:glycosyltransferase [Variovorax sp. OV329]|uniref:glycosyltransferase n=1 Tax=Variovorax sp. OV329 TaxID=1882825 RepID=UPI0008E720DD|nr:glycosyltransferase [Variovorax sp. OV329]SFN06962.1 Glycosyltransferase involved in cell wall bisynthesis [Variovorax sp. OV329]
MRIVIDLQGAQSSGSRNRGIGRYTNALSLGIAELARSRHELIFALNGQFDEAIEEIRQRFAGLVEPHNFRVWNPPAYGQLASAGGRRANEKLYEGFLASLEPDVVLIASLFEGLSDAAVTSIGAFARLRTATVLYDLIPLINAKPYLDNAPVREWYLRKVAALRRADMWFAISESSRQEGIRYLGLDPLRCINVSTAADPQFRIEDVPAQRAQDLRQQYGLQRPFVMYTGGIDLRKNIEGLIRAFALLPATLRENYQLAIVCSARSQDKQTLLDLARAEGLADGDVVVTGFVPDDDLVTLYNLCHLFVFPSWHEGFGLPALEAMNCGAVVLGANTSSVPEVIGRSDALFDPHDPKAMAIKIGQGLTDEAFRNDLCKHALTQARKFSWRQSAQKALDGLERLKDLEIEAPQLSLQGVRPRLAYVSPLPPERSGIANYSAELVPYLAKYYDIELISDLPAVDDGMLSANFPVRSTAWFRENPRQFDRVLYHFGNSEFHQHMFELLAEVPGVVVQHDFFLSGLQSYLEDKRKNPLAWVQSLYASHGYAPLAERFASQDGAAKVLFKYPASFDVLALAQGVVVHSLHAIDLARKWFAPDVSRHWAMVPLPRTLKQVDAHARVRLRAELGLADDDFMVCTFGIIGATKLSLRLIEAWQASPLSRSAKCHLVFVGNNDAGPYGKEVAQALASAAEGSIRITGWASNEMFEKYLAASDLAVQLRTQSRGETSATVLDTLSHGVATIVNASGSMADLPDSAVWKLPEEFSKEQLTQALITLWSEPLARSELAARGRQLIEFNHTPAECARRYFEAIEMSAARAAGGRDGLVSAIRADWESSPDTATAGDAPVVAQAIADSLPLPAPARQLLVDVSELVQRDASTGIQSVVKGLLRELLESPPAGFRVEPVYAVRGELGYRYARQFTLEFLGCPRTILVDLPIDARAGDLFVGLDLEPRIVLAQRAFYRRMRQRGVRVEFVVYDLLPILLPDRFMNGAEELHAKWLGVVAENDGALCISRSVADELRHWVATDERAGRPRPGFAIGAFHLGVDDLPKREKQESDWDAKLQAAVASRPTFLMVGTIEPRKGYALVLDAFDRLWARGLDVNLVLVGREGWMVDALVKTLKAHPRLGKQLFWIERADDAMLDRLYAAASCLIAASEGEGFGLPIIEAAQRGLPVLARDIPVFREVGGDGATYFGGDPDSLAHVAANWLADRRPASTRYLSWRESAEQFKQALRIT